MSLAIPQHYPLVGLGVAGLWAVNIWQQILVMKARKESGVAYPNLYATDAEAKADPKKHRFNCVQRANQNSLENVTFVLPLSLFFGLFHPKLATAFTLTYIVGRIGYTLGYSSGQPDKRNNMISRVQYIGLFGLLIGTINVSAKAAIAYVQSL
ncbi:hypothetical protein DB88DRAFT_155646 [Papiliotrema laurentii]|uniref:Membrane-associated proteins in eicosanoid and glutathione metabolism n=1 Tax=Papiliotrema laurentii TaxID=5418 RepID=A0AAD9FTW3_PAPLA|nr:hypothetical protein DB88DRAFT_155646 [Papiliotrema laurentii]